MKMDSESALPNRNTLDKLNIASLPDWKKAKDPFQKIARLDIDTEKKDTIILWWKENPKILNEFLELESKRNSVSLPRNEAKEVEHVYNEALTKLQLANNKITDFVIEAGDLESLPSKIIDLYVEAVGTTKKDKEAEDIVTAISEFKDFRKQMNLTSKVVQAIIETRSANPDENILRKKAAQEVFEEMFDQLAARRRETLSGVDLETSSVIDSPITEKIELTSAFLANTWTGDERKKMLRNYNKLKRVLNRLEADTEVVIRLNTLWKWANGKLPKDASIFKILNYANDLDSAVTDVVSEAWQNEADQIADEEESED